MIQYFKAIFTVLFAGSCLITANAKIPENISLRNFEINRISYEWEAFPDRDDFKRIFVDAFYQCYKEIPLDVLKLPASIDVKEWLESFVDDTLDNLKKPESQLLLLSAKKNGIPAAYAVFDMNHFPDYVYLGELSVDPVFQHQGIGKQLVYAIVEQFPETKKIVLVTRKANFQACAFYPAIGFESSEYMQQGYNPELYTGFEYENKIPSSQAF
ncbi:MAG: GNAT family N-acetyltransferase [Chlamydiota bacterium]